MFFGSSLLNAPLSGADLPVSVSHVLRIFRVPLEPGAGEIESSKLLSSKISWLTGKSSSPTSWRRDWINKLAGWLPKIWLLSCLFQASRNLVWTPSLVLRKKRKYFAVVAIVVVAWFSMFAWNMKYELTGTGLEVEVTCIYFKVDCSEVHKRMKISYWM